MRCKPATLAARLRLNLIGAAALMLLCSACGDGIPKDRGDDDDDPPPQSTAMTVFAGDASVNGTMDGTGTAARFNNPRGLAIDADGNLYVADTGNATVRKITPAGVVTTMAGAAGMTGTANGSAANARFENPVAVAVNKDGTVFVADNRNIRSITTGGQVSTYSTLPIGTGVAPGSIPDVAAGALALDADGNLFITNAYGSRRLAPNKEFVMMEGQSVVNGLSGTRQLLPRGVATDANGNTYLYDLDGRISKWALTSFNTMTLTGLAGAPGTKGAANGTGTAARFEQVVGLTVDPKGNVYAADTTNNLVRKITPAGVVTTLAGTTRANVLTPGGLPGSLAEVRGIVTDGKGNLYVTSGNAIVKIVLP
ncbi:hypothetical protein [Massilia sp. ZL223]|uniref:NHL domain-containing protein n=1 Tax=Massilia sp. ZL223 TaxID=2824904 RepID=UPI001B81F4A9|nr:hypothetical protein [Massilia sp. ZL223]MBQ5963799.1 hypothetical protein [Massilia sp. ZL223]